MSKHRAASGHGAVRRSTQSNAVRWTTALARIARSNGLVRGWARTSTSGSSDSNCVLLRARRVTLGPLAHTVDVLDALHSVRQRPVVA